jgi:hypothetical protein
MPPFLLIHLNILLLGRISLGLILIVRYNTSQKPGFEREKRRENHLVTRKWPPIPSPWPVILHSAVSIGKHSL